MTQVITGSGSGPHGAVFQSRRPPLRLTAIEAGALISRTPRLPVDALAREAPKGDGHAVLVLPGLLRGDAWTPGPDRVIA